MKCTCKKTFHKLAFYGFLKSVRNHQKICLKKNIFENENPQHLTPLSCEFFIDIFFFYFEKIYNNYEKFHSCAKLM